MFGIAYTKIIINGFGIDLQIVKFLIVIENLTVNILL